MPSMDQPSKQGLALQLGLHLLSGHRDRTFYPHSRIPYEVLAVDPNASMFRYAATSIFPFQSASERPYQISKLAQWTP